MQINSTFESCRGWFGPVPNFCIDSADEFNYVITCRDIIWGEYNSQEIAMANATQLLKAHSLPSVSIVEQGLLNGVLIQEEWSEFALDDAGQVATA